jgi:uncharacterized protein
MTLRKMEVGKCLLVRIAHDSELLYSIISETKRHRITTATFTAIGALKSAKLGYYDQGKHIYYDKSFEEHLEICSCTGNISQKEGKLFAHAHVVVSDQNGNTKGGHLIEGKVFAAEVHLIELVGKELIRVHDSITDLFLWDI